MIFFILIWAICSVGFFALAISMNKHQKQIFAKALADYKTRLAAVIGWILLATGLIICVCAGNLSNMISYWIGVLTFSALFVGLCLSYYAEKIPKIAIATALVALISLLFYCFF